MAERLCNYASVVGRDHVIAGTDCGFGTSRLHPTIAYLKLQTLVEGARLASQKLWGRQCCAPHIPRAIRGAGETLCPFARPSSFLSQRERAGVRGLLSPKTPENTRLPRATLAWSWQS